MTRRRIDRLPAYTGHARNVHAVIEAPMRTRNKFSFDAETETFKLTGVLPAGMYFPHDFGFVPSTLADDGDPIDVLVLADEPLAVGCTLDARLIGVIEARQTEKGHSFRNDRLIAVAIESYVYARVRALRDLDPPAVKQIEDFFVAYNKGRGKTFEPLARRGESVAHALVRAAMKKFESREGS
jgi:inorganic pyrophosphatase